MEQIQKETAIIRELEKYSTSTIAICMQRGKDYQKRAQLFDSRKDKWYTEAALHAGMRGAAFACHGRPFG